ncbi:hypothetical protein, conserved [Eimeria necatrix]|uniref:Uncharacterized protein n=1 Tax=Eimeria necatrix TaxID=51315 RepID=U6MHZ5_9EIME|nr:hypothetical protein, conserved [Eimeria necatrix]CDJ62054.1 hypothetical protein, conserved [Eimeria necatrix]
MMAPGCVPEANCTFSIDIEPTSVDGHEAEDSAASSLSEGRIRGQYLTQRRHEEVIGSGSNAEGDAGLLCPHYNQHHKGKHYKQYLQQKSAEAQAIKETTRPPLWRVPIVRQPLPVSVEEFNPAEPKYAKFVKALWSHAKATVEDKSRAQDFSESPMGRDPLPERCTELDETGWRRKEPIQHSWQDRPGSVGRPSSPTVLRQGPSWLVDAEGYEGPYGSKGDLRSKGMSYESRFQLPTLSSLMKAKHAVFVKAKDPRAGRCVSERKRTTRRRQRRTGRCLSSPPSLQTATVSFEMVPSEQPQQPPPAAVAPTVHFPSPLPPSPKGSPHEESSPKSDSCSSPRTSLAPSSDDDKGRSSSQETTPSKQASQRPTEGGWTLQITGKGKCRYPENYVRWKRDKRRMKDRLKRLKAGQIFTSERPEGTCTACQSPSLWWDPQPLAEHLHSVRSFGSAPEDDTSSGSDLSPSSRSSSSTTSTDGDSSPRSCNSFHDKGDDPVMLESPQNVTYFSSAPPTVTNTVVVPPTHAYPLGGTGALLPLRQFVHCPLRLPCTPVIVGSSRPLQRHPRSQKPLCLAGAYRNLPGVCCSPETPPKDTDACVAGPLLASSPPHSLPFTLPQHHILLTPEVQQGQILLPQHMQQMQQETCMVQAPQRYVTMQMPGTGISPQIVTVCSPQQGPLEPHQQPQRLQYEVQQEMQPQKEQKTHEQRKKKSVLKELNSANIGPQPRSEWSRNGASNRFKQQAASGKTHMRRGSAPPSASRQTARSSTVGHHQLPAHPTPTMPGPPLTSHGGCHLIQHGQLQGLVSQPPIVAPQPLGGPQLLSATPGAFYSGPQVVSRNACTLYGASQMAPGIGQRFQGGSTPLHNSQVLPLAPTQVMLRPPQQGLGGTTWAFPGTANPLQTTERLASHSNLLGYNAQHAVTCTPPRQPIFVGAFPSVAQQQAPTVVKQSLLQPLLIQKAHQGIPIPQQQYHGFSMPQQQQLLTFPQQPVVVQQKQQPIVIQQQQQGLTFQQQQPLVMQRQQPVVIQQQHSSQPTVCHLVKQQPSPPIVIPQQQRTAIIAPQPSTVVVQRPPTIVLQQQKPTEQKPTESKPKEKPKVPWLWNCSINCGARCGSNSPSSSRGEQREQQAQQPRKEPEQPAERVQPKEKPLRPSATGYETKAHWEHPCDTAAAPSTAGAERATNAVAHGKRPSPQRSASEATQRTVRDSRQTQKYLRPPQQGDFLPASPRKYQQPVPLTQTMPPLVTSTHAADLGSQQVWMSPAPVVCMQNQQLQQQAQKQALGVLNQEQSESQCSERDAWESPDRMEPTFKYLPFTFRSPKRNIICGTGKAEHSREVPASATVTQQQQRSSCCGTPGAQLSASLTCSM